MKIPYTTAKGRPQVQRVVDDFAGAANCECDYGRRVEDLCWSDNALSHVNAIGNHAVIWIAGSL